MLFFQTEIMNSGARGRGVFAAEHIPAGALIERAPVIVMPAEDRPHLDQTLLHDYIFEWQPEGRPMCCMALGQVPIYNHSYRSNASYEMDYEAQTIAVVAERAIAPGEEIFINYNGDWDDETPVWFDAK
ncbi:SET domain-containing protein [Rurimicrobium arvi]|uniref:SET domain-containing protein-lysine N-methyltransferase n=1 Tax=Rurimicrobium arvi TaxID=2049916 RepID=A0ABP8MZ89_9BACT